MFPFFRFTQKSSNDFFQEYFLSFPQIEKGKVVQTQSYSQSLPHAQIREMEDGSFDFIFTNIVGRGGKIYSLSCIYDFLSTSKGRMRERVQNFDLFSLSRMMERKAYRSFQRHPSNVRRDSRTVIENSSQQQILFRHKEFRAVFLKLL